MRNIDNHPKRYDRTRNAIELVLLRRMAAGRLDGCTLETSLEIMDVLPNPARNAEAESED